MGCICCKINNRLKNLEHELNQLQMFVYNKKPSEDSDSLSSTEKRLYEALIDSKKFEQLIIPEKYKHPEHSNSIKKNPSFHTLKDI